MKDLTETLWELMKRRWSYYDAETMDSMRRIYLETVRAWPVTQEEVDKMEVRV